MAMNLGATISRTLNRAKPVATTDLVSFIVAAYDRPEMLRCCLASLQVQTHRNIEVLVADNTKNQDVSRQHEGVTVELCDSRFRYFNTGLDVCYAATRALAPQCHGEWLCFPNDDGYYVPQFTELMLAGSRGADFVYCDMLMDPRLYGVYHVLKTKPKLYRIDKGGFLIRKSVFEKFDWPPAPDDYCRDGLLVEQLRKARVRMSKAKGVLFVHN